MTEYARAMMRLAITEDRLYGRVQERSDFC
jgi:hypothetical protein